jgi:heme o synthase
MNTDTDISILPVWREYLVLTKPRVVLLLSFTALVGVFLSVTGWPPLIPALAGVIGIWLAGSSAAAVNQVIDQHIDSEMARTRRRPLPTGRLTEVQALRFALILAVLAMLILLVFVNALTALLTFVSLIGYAMVYTLWLKRATPQNIVIGGAAGAAPPLLGWCAITGHIDPPALLLFLIVFAWTPPHFWALAIARQAEYAKVGVPMLPVAYSAELTRLHILLYTILLFIVTLLVWVANLSGLIYLLASIVLNIGFMVHAWRLYRDPAQNLPMPVFKYSITYLGLLFLALLVDHYWLIRI